MAGAALKINVEINDHVIQQALTRLADAGAGMKPAFADIGEYLLISTKERFDAQESPDGEPWAQLADSTLRRKMLKGVRRGKGQKRKSLTTQRGNTKIGAVRALSNDLILVLRGYLRDTLAYDATSGGLEFGTNREYGATHQFGDDDRNIPARPFLGLSADDEAEIIEILQEHLEQALHA
ncbi:MAG: phage virion morphogenesis protein [Chromatiales bacterium]|nr:phage virion morphogenesis protein [Gammaproteobacteria bacterium]